MIQIQKPLSFVLKVLGKQNYNGEKKYRTAYFCSKISKENEFLIYNNLTHNYLALSLEEYKQLQESNYSLPKDLVKYMVENWFLVPDNNDDYLLCAQIKNLAKLFDKEKVVHNFTILPTTGCNARCFYCYQAGTKIKTMDRKTAFDVSRYIVEKSGDKDISLNWFGGEPLCNMEAINIICGELIKAGKTFTSNITSNGYLFDEEIVKTAKNKWLLKRAQITLDGLPETYARVKNFRNGDNSSFYRVLENIKRLCENSIRVEIRLNMDDYNYDELMRLVELLAEKFSKYNNILVYARPIYENVGFEQISHTNDSRKEIFDKFNSLKCHIAEKGLSGIRALPAAFRVSCCQADDETWRLILPDGKFVFCEHFLDDDSYGSIYDDAQKPIWSDYCEPEEKCKTCFAYMECVKLKKCPESYHGCYDYEQAMRMERIYQGMEKIYAEYFNKNI